MKKFSNILLITALIMVVVANLLFWGAKIIRYINREDYNKDIGNVNYSVSGKPNALKIDAQAVDVVIKTGDTFGCLMENVDKSQSGTYVDNTTLCVEAKNKENISILGWDIGNCLDPQVRAKVTVTVPSGSLESFELDLGAGNVDIDSIIASRTVMQVGIGNINAGKIASSGTAAVQTGWGSTNINSFEANDCSIVSGIGNVDLKLSGNREDYEIKAKSTLGEVNILGRWQKWLLSDLLYQGGTNRHVDIETGVGCIKVKD